MSGAPPAALVEIRRGLDAFDDAGIGDKFKHARTVMKKIRKRFQGFNCAKSTGNFCFGNGNSAAPAKVSAQAGFCRPGPITSLTPLATLRTSTYWPRSWRQPSAGRGEAADLPVVALGGLYGSKFAACLS